MSKKFIPPVPCPRCGSQTHPWGHPAGRRHLQRYRCKNPTCHRQFVPGQPERPKKYPSFSCPQCGAKMAIFKHLSDGYRLRCNHHIYKDNRHCAHKVNIPFPGKSFNIAKDPIQAISNQIASTFTWSKMDFSNPAVSLVLYFAVFKSLPATEVSEIMQTLYQINISHDTVTRWTHKSALCIHKNLGPLSTPNTPRRRSFTDETVFWVRGQKRWVWLTRESRFDSDQAWFLSPRRSTEYARNTFNIAFTASPHLKNAPAITDGLWSYGSALPDLGFDTKRLHKVYKGFFETTNNNRLERRWSTLKVKARRYRGFKSDLGLWAFVTHQVYLHNYFQPNQRLDGKTPAEATGVKLPYCLSKWKLFCRFI